MSEVRGVLRDPHYVQTHPLSPESTVSLYYPRCMARVCWREIIQACQFETDRHFIYITNAKSSGAVQEEASQVLVHISFIYTLAENDTAPLQKEWLRRHRAPSGRPARTPAPRRKKRHFEFGSRLALQCRGSCRGDKGWFCWGG